VRISAKEEKQETRARANIHFIAGRENIERRRKQGKTIEIKTYINSFS
jgi:hypothetical protein